MENQLKANLFLFLCFSETTIHCIKRPGAYWSK